MEKVIVWKSGDGFRATVKSNYDARIVDDSLVMVFRTVEGFECFEDVVDYLTMFCRVGRQDVTLINR